MDGSPTPVSRRALVRAAAAGGALAAGPVLWQRPAAAGSPPAEQLHLQFGSDAARQATVSWATDTAVARPRVRLGTPEGGLGSVVEAETRTYRDAATGVEVVTHHAALDRLRPGTRYDYQVLHDGARPLAGSFRTGPDGRAPFRFTSFGDQGTGSLRDAVSGPHGRYVVDQVEAQQPLFHLLNGDLCYANVNADRPGVWGRFFGNNMRSARNRPWMPCAGNHENESGNGPQGYLGYATRFALPDNGSSEFAGFWYAFTVGNVRVVSLNNDDVCYQDGGDTYIRGYSGGRQRAWLESTLADARSDRRIDWVVVCMHQLALSSANGNGCDLGVREEFVPLFDRYGVDLVLCGHDHNYERSHPVRGVEPGSPTLRPRVADRSSPSSVDTTLGTVHLTLGGGGTSLPTNTYLGDAPGAPTARVITGKSASETEPAPWSAVRDRRYPWGFAVFDVDPGRPGGTTRVRVRYLRTAPSSSGSPAVFDAFELRRPRSDAPERGR